jgi:choline dehydrogenase-like flavoprotein
MPFIDALDLNDDSVIEADLCIVGAGAAGIALAREFIGDPQRIALIESGGLDFRHKNQALYIGANTGLENFSTCRSRFRMFGGSTTRWGGQCLPFDELDFEARPWIPDSGWPIARRDLDPYYRRAAQTCNLIDDQQLERATAAGSVLPVDTDRLALRHFRFAHPMNFGERYREELASATNVAVYLNANVVEIEVDDPVRTITGLRLATWKRQRLEVRARAYVLAAGGIENPRLMLASSRTANAGIGNQHGLVGRFFMDHPYLWSGAYQPSAPGFDRTAHVIEDYDRVGIEQKTLTGFTLSERILRAEQLNGCIAYFARRPRHKALPAYVSPAGMAFMHLVEVATHAELPNRHFGRHVRSALTGLGDVGRILGRQAVERIRPAPTLCLRLVLEQTPNPDSRVTLGRRRDAFGMPRVEVDWRMRADDKRGLLRLARTLQEEFQRQGLGRLTTYLDDDDATGWPSCMIGGRHHISTTRMHADPRRGVVDPDCRVHGLANLYVAGSSVFPTGSYANPTMTIVAIAIRLADHLKERRP